MGRAFALFVWGPSLEAPSSSSCYNFNSAEVFCAFFCLFVSLVGSCFYHCNIRGMNGQITGFLPSSVFQDMPGQSPDFWSASAATNDTAFHYHAAKLCPVVG